MIGMQLVSAVSANELSKMEAAMESALVDRTYADLLSHFGQLLSEVESRRVSVSALVPLPMPMPELPLGVPDMPPSKLVSIPVTVNDSAPATRREKPAAPKSITGLTLIGLAVPRQRDSNVLKFGEYLANAVH